LGQLFNVVVVSLAQQLHQCCRQQFSATPLAVALQLMPISIANAEQLMQRFSLGCGGVGPWGVG